MIIFTFLIVNRWKTVEMKFFVLFSILFGFV